MPRPQLRSVSGTAKKDQASSSSTTKNVNASLNRSYDRFGLTMLATVLGALAVGNLLVYLGAFQSFPQVAVWLTVSKEASLATWIQVQLWAAVGVLAWLEAWTFRRAPEKRGELYRWAFIGAFFFWLSVDDFLSVHEAFGQALRHFFAAGGFGNFGQAFANYRSNLWLVSLGPLYAIGLYVTLDGLRHKLPRTRFLRLVPAALGCFAIAVGIDFVEGILRRSGGHDFWAMPGANWLYLAVSLEELVEIAGTGLLLQATIDATIPGLRRYLVAR